MTKEDAGSQEELERRAIENEDYLNILKNLGRPQEDNYNY